MKNVFLTDLKEGMVLGRDLVTSAGIMILPAGVVITAPIIKHLETLGVVAVSIDDKAKVEEKEPELAEPDVTTDERKAGFEEFSHKYIDAKDSLNNTFGIMINNNIDKSDVEEIIDKSWNMLGTEYNSYNMLNMLYSMHNYSDTTYMHCMNVGMIASLIGKWLGWKEEDIKILNACGMFHDIGKLLIPKEILDKPGRLTLSEYEIMKSHTIRGYQLIKEWELNEHIVNCALMHHERCNGSGYPFGITGDKIDEYAKIIAIADVYEAMTANRAYRGPICPFDVVAQFEDKGFDLYETRYLLVFIQNIVDSYLHTKVKLNNGETAEIILINKQRGSKPVVITSTGRPVDLSKEPGLRIEEVYES